LFNASDAQSEVTDNHWVPTVHINNTDGLVIKDYIATATDPTARINGGQYAPAQGSVMAAFSSRGPDPVATDIIKPDITAPGVNILAGASPTPYLGQSESPAPGQLFQSISGTSMSSPHIAGIFALIKQAHPDWSAAVAKSAIMTSARQDVFKEDGTTAADPFDMGAGHVDPGEKVHKGSAFQPGLAYEADFLDYLGFLCAADPSTISPGFCLSLESIGVPTTAENLNYPSIGVSDVPGSITVTRTVSSVASERGWREYTPSIEAPAGFEVSVSPAKLRLKSGDSATFEVTITNESAPIGEWRFGSLTWEDKTGNYTVYSPIAARASLFSASASVEGSGENGSVSFDVTFGYTGEYAAAAHGLEPATVTTDNVVQDPDQEFDPTDGYSNRHDFNVSGAAYFKVAIPPEAVASADIDLDVFVYDPAGDLVGTSTNGGTDEVVEFLSPADGTWSVYVHGWQTVGASADYDMYTWIVSATPGGNMSVDSAPTSATIGSTETIDLSWSGATDGQWHLGAVSHADGRGLLGLTLVDVDNR
ncbi:MAG: S8 family serine peptidase, partial [Acidimicrobiia bacterium]